MLALSSPAEYRYGVLAHGRLMDAQIARDRAQEIFAEVANTCDQLLTDGQYQGDPLTREASDATFSATYKIWADALKDVEICKAEVNRLVVQFVALIPNPDPLVGVRQVLA